DDINNHDENQDRLEQHLGKFFPSVRRRNRKRHGKKRGNKEQEGQVNFVWTRRRSHRSVSGTTMGFCRDFSCVGGEVGQASLEASFSRPRPARPGKTPS